MKTYVDTACKEGFGVIDVNLPKYVTDFDSDNQEHRPNDDVDFRIKEAKQLLKYLWDNYVALNSSTHVYLMGTNTGHGAIIGFLKDSQEIILRDYNDREEHRNTLKVITFVEDVSLMSCKSLVGGDDELPNWYHRNSLVLVAEEHAYFASDFARKPKRRFGRVVRSSKNTITEMLVEHKKDVFEVLMEDADAWKEERPSREDDIMDVMPSSVVSPKRLPQPAQPPASLEASFVLPPPANGVGSAAMNGDRT